MTGGERTALSGRTIPPHGDLDPVRERLRDDVGAEEIETEVGDLVRFSSLGRLHCVPSDEVQADSRAALHPRVAEILPWLQRVAESVRILQAIVQLVIKRIGEGRRRRADAQNHPCRFAAGKGGKVARRAVHERSEAGVRRRRRRLGGRRLPKRRRRGAVEQASEGLGAKRRWIIPVGCRTGASVGRRLVTTRFDAVAGDLACAGSGRADDQHARRRESCDDRDTEHANSWLSSDAVGWSPMKEGMLRKPR
jgi:hypothetical protein